LHRHLDGSVRPCTLEELALRAHCRVPHDLPFRAGMGLDAALSKFAFTLSLLQEPTAVRRVASEICEDAAADNVTTLEIRFAPQLHKGGSIEAIVDAAVEGVAGRAGLILCGLYGEEIQILDELVRVASLRASVVGVDLAGGPSGAHGVHLGDYAPAFRRAAELGLGRTVHAGEGRCVEEVRTAVELLGANRIGHGTTLLDDPAVVDLVLERGVTIEACITSNVHVGAIVRVAEHPLARWLALGVRAAICTDNTLLSQVSASSEHDVARTLPGMTAQLLSTAVTNGHAAAFRRISR
jgi:adenosine deaminase